MNNKKIINPNAERYITEAHNMINAVYRDTHQDPAHIFSFMMNALYKFSDSTLQSNPMALTGAPCSAFAWFAIANEIKAKIDVYVSSSNLITKGH